MEPSGAFRALLSGDEQAMELDAAALELSTLHTGYTDPAPALRQLDEWAGQIEEMLMPGAAGAPVVPGNVNGNPRKQRTAK